jgi:hypothetical protein
MKEYPTCYSYQVIHKDQVSLHEQKQFEKMIIPNLIISFTALTSPIPSTPEKENDQPYSSQ